MTRASVLIACNLSLEPRRIAIPAGTATTRVLIKSDDAIRHEGGFIDMPAESVAILGP
jgi:hypothetical protein